VNPVGNQIGNYMYASSAGLKRRTVAGVVFIIGIASAYNAFGLIGSEHNGVFILDDTNRNVIADQIEITSSGWFGPTAAQMERQRFLAETATDAEFLDFIKKHPRYRGVFLPSLEAA
jgi:hypothetical protein